MTIKKFIRSTLSGTRLGAKWLAIRDLGLSSHLHTQGWFASRATSTSVDASGAPLPWYTYGAIAFLEPRLRANMSIFEFGSGNSTLWWSRRVSRVASCEHDSDWYEDVRSRLPSNVEYRLATLGENGEYAQSVLQGHRTFDIVVIDGRDRVACALNTPRALKGDGVIVWDNSDRSEYQSGYDYLVEQGFKRIDFWGMGPINTYGWCTSIFYRRENCLGI
jgi:hypothetical protein